MCGILGSIGFTEKEFFKRALDNLAHRGPDAEGLWHHENVMLGHRRLSIIDLSESANQPFEFLNYVAVFNGEIYNYLELKKELVSFGYQFTTDSDTEVLIAAYDKWKDKFVKRLNGMWAVAIWNKTLNSLFLSRDRIGKKPLFYLHQKENFFFASEMKGLYPFIDHLEFNMPVIQDAIKNNFGYEVKNESLIKNIIRFPAGCNGYLVNNKLSIDKYWHPLDELIEVPNKYEAQVEMFRDLFLNACKIRMRSDVPIGTALSGGLDSSSVICSLNHLAQTHDDIKTKDWQHAFIACFPGTSIDETGYAKKVTNALDIGSNFIVIDPELELEKLFHQTYMFEEIYYAPTIPFVQLYRKMRQGGIKVSIDGHGADELFAGYPFDMELALIDAFPNPTKFKEIASIIQDAYSRKNPELYKKFKYSLVNNFKFLSPIAKNTPIYRKIAPLDYLNTQLFKSTYSNILPTLLRNYDRYSMMNGIEIRMPFLDYRILQFAFSIPYDSKIRKGFGKAIIRDAMRGIVPEEIVNRKSKIGFNSPLHTWLQGRMKKWIVDQINSKSFAESNLIDAKKVKKDLEQLLAKKELSYTEAELTFAKIIPYIWETGMKSFAKGKNQLPL
ncbi:MAG: hypothetical protein RIQ89_1298 [Bacteroidota bacterium]|jgi:asparagine synthase (glutamine-hydrolysing)